MALPASPYWQLRLGSDGEAVTGLEELSQALRILVTTPPGSVPLRPEFGCATLAFLDQPIAEALPGLIREITRAVLRWEPRIELRRVTVSQTQPVTLRLTWRPSGAIGDQLLEVGA